MPGTSSCARGRRSTRSTSGARATAFSALRPGEVFFFKLKAPHNAIGGFGLFARFAPLPVWRAWDIFGQANGTADAYELLNRLGRLAPARTPMSMDRVIGCIAERSLGPYVYGVHADAMRPLWAR